MNFLEKKTFFLTDVENCEADRKRFYANQFQIYVSYVKEFIFRQMQKKNCSVWQINLWRIEEGNGNREIVKIVGKSDHKSWFNGVSDFSIID